MLLVLLVLLVLLALLVLLVPLVPLVLLVLTLSLSLFLSLSYLSSNRADPTHSKVKSVIVLPGWQLTTWTAA